MIQKVYDQVVAKNPGEKEFHQAVKEVLESLEPVITRYPKYVENHILHRIVEPERQIMFKVAWVDEKGQIQVNRGFRVQFNSAIGPYKGGLRFHPSVNLGIIKFLGFEQIFKNSLTGLSMGGGKGGSDFDPKGKTDLEVMRFCQAFMNELYRHLGTGGNTDVPAGDIGVGGREIGYLFGQYLKLTGRFEGVLTGKGLEWGGSLIRPEATGYGAVYFSEAMLKTKNKDLKGKKCLVSGSGNVAQYTIEKLNQLGAIPITASDSDGTIYDPDGIKGERFEFLMNLKNIKRGRIKEYADKFNVEYLPNKHPWGIKCDLAFPSATQNEINAKDAQNLVDNGCIAVIEGANMPTMPDGVKILIDAGVMFAPGKAANAGGVAVSGLEMAQNSMRMAWTRDEVDAKLKFIMNNIHNQAYNASKEYGKPGNYVLGANIAGFVKVANAMIALGVI